eukprot:TRINITY_DN7435_c0_g1_i5.p1 TRINITY_DN7435_c0_g1~~TRINITY_DN7435_c0_g1_i5.p1  ORF type:complete len:205 (+),score=14.71 TRINITY_DN7435_c0_g1_i5:52-666(+)
MDGSYRRLSYRHPKGRCFSITRNKIVLVNNPQIETIPQTRLVAHQKRLQQIEQMIRNSTSNIEFMDIMQKKHINIKDKRSTAECMQRLIQIEHKLQQTITQHKPQNVSLDPMQSAKNGIHIEGDVKRNEYLSSTIDERQEGLGKGGGRRCESFVGSGKPSYSKLSLASIKKMNNRSNDFYKNVVGKRLVRVMPFLKNGKIQIKL